MAFLLLFRMAFFTLSSLSVWWLRLGISIERIKPGHPQQNGRHECMHLTLKKEATRPPGENIFQQQAKFDDFIKQYNNDRPHESLGMKYPTEIYKPSPRVYTRYSQIWCISGSSAWLDQAANICSAGG
jgi:transposase InsO family protein